MSVHFYVHQLSTEKTFPTCCSPYAQAVGRGLHIIPWCTLFRLCKALHSRKNALYYRSERGAAVGDLFMSLIQTSRLEGVNPFEYLTALQRHAQPVRERPGEWLPWNFRSTLKKLGAASPRSPPPRAQGGGDKPLERGAG
jgi:hypothetical protein